ncbi:MAG: thioredoxin domain-containing protein, partial [Bacteroidetes bacterium]|nr:thioredoxin domain-containing protein [Bacteroidota bacterium]
MITTGSKYTNHLINENSPYLLQHAHNPVNWFPWGEEAFIKARSENKLVLVSIGYAACHWCHVMEHESFEDEEVARLMNEYFVCIKVDREERPDIDQVYMDAVQLLTRSGGWPLNCFALPDGRPVFGGTYFPKENWKQVLQSLNEVYTRDYEKVIEQANAITTGLSDIGPLLQGEQTSAFTTQFIDQYYNTLSRSFDKIHGGNKGAPKFPMPVIYEYLLRHYFHTQNTEALDATLLTLDKMAQGGIFDHL